MTAKDTTVAALKMAIRNRPLIRPLFFHSDRGVQYACDEFRRELRAYPLISQSMSRRANCWDNAVAETLSGRSLAERNFDPKIFQAFSLCNPYI